MAVTETGTTFTVTDTEGLTYVIYALSSITLIASADDGAIKSDGIFNGVLRLAKLNEEGHKNLLDNHSSVYPTSATLQYELGDKNGAIVFTWNTVGSGELLMLTWPHHRKVMQSPNFPPTSSLGYLTTKVCTSPSRMNHADYLGLDVSRSW
jgi:endo-1,3(4)-beta-glucanase